jgi:hypothetical protein
LTYLYGDSSPSPLQFNFIELLKDALGFAVRLLLAELRLDEHEERGRSLERAYRREVEELDQLGQRLGGALTSYVDPETQVASAARRCASQMARASQELLKAEHERLRAGLHGQLGKLREASLAERTACLTALEAVLLRHDFPETAHALTVRLESGSRYGAQLRGVTPFGLDTSVELEVPAQSVFSSLLRLDRVGGLDLNLPGQSGWLRKEERVQKTRLGKHYVIELTLEPAARQLMLRSSPDGKGDGYDIIARTENRRLNIIRYEEGAAASSPFEILDEDREPVLQVLEKLQAAALDLGGNRKRLAYAKLGEQPMLALERPRPLVERLIFALAPIAKDVADHSLSPGELVLKRLLRDGRREEIFVTWDELNARLEPLPAELRGVFAPLGLGRGAPPPPPAARPEPAPEPARRPPSVGMPQAGPGPLGTSGSSGPPALPPRSPSEPQARNGPPPLPARGDARATLEEDTIEVNTIPGVDDLPGRPAVSPLSAPPPRQAPNPLPAPPPPRRQGPEMAPLPSAPPLPAAPPPRATAAPASGARANDDDLDALIRELQGSG